MSGTDCEDEDDDDEGERLAHASAARIGYRRCSGYRAVKYSITSESASETSLPRAVKGLQKMFTYSSH